MSIILTEATFDFCKNCDHHFRNYDFIFKFMSKICFIFLFHLFFYSKLHVAPFSLAQINLSFINYHMIIHMIFLIVEEYLSQKEL